jgi:hypothetical protein
MLSVGEWINFVFRNSFTYKKIKMKKILLLLLLAISIHTTVHAEEQYAKTLNLGLGIGYYGYVGHSLPVFHINYELPVAKNFTLAPFLTFYTYSNDYYWGNNNHQFRYYTYRQTVIPVGVKGTYYFDDILEAGTKWDFYLAASLGFSIVSSSWESDYDGDRNAFHGASSLYLDFHIGTEYHFNDHIGMFLDLSTGVSTVGLAIH